IKDSRVLDTKEGKINPVKVYLLQKLFSEEDLIKGFNTMTEEIDRDFHTLSYLLRFF
ncbi:pentapeptide repeat-containing protein, partial [Clostridium saudiense]|nr:pentapeptide repeat-containing protein [Clostridium saudiense]